MLILVELLHFDDEFENVDIKFENFDIEFVYIFIFAFKHTNDFSIDLFVFFDFIEIFDQRVIVFYVIISISDDLNFNVTIDSKLIQHLYYCQRIFANSQLKLFNDTNVYRVFCIVRVVICIFRKNVI